MAAIRHACARREILVLRFDLEWIYQDQQWVPRPDDVGLPTSGVTAIRTPSPVAGSDTGESPRSQSGPQTKRQQPAMLESRDKAIVRPAPGPRLALRRLSAASQVYRQVGSNLGRSDSALPNPRLPVACWTLNGRSSPISSTETMTSTVVSPESQ